MQQSVTENRIYEMNINKLSARDVGKQYWFRRGIEKGFFGMNFYTYLNEQFIDGALQFLMNENNLQPSAFQTNDSLADNFNTYTYSRLVVHLDMTIVVCRKNENGADMLLFKVTRHDTPETSTENRVEVKFVKYIDSIYDYSNYLEYSVALTHARRFFNSRFYRGRAQLVERFAVNPHRSFETHIYTPNDFGLMYSYRNNGTFLMLSKNAEENEIDRYSRKVPVVMRTFYRKAKEARPRAVVDGVRLSMMLKNDLSHYLELNGDRHKIVKVFIKGYSVPVFGTNNYGSKIRLIYKVEDRYRSFLLNEYEMSLVTRVEPI